MERNELDQAVTELFESKPSFTSIEGRDGTSARVRLFDAPLAGTASARDPLFERFKEPGVIGPSFRTPQEWLPGARSVVALFFPFSEAVRASNRGDVRATSAEWLHGRIEGQAYLAEHMAKGLVAWFESRNAQAIAPALDGSFAIKRVPNPAIPGDCMFESAWSERHAAYVAGLGTFGLSRSLITRRGTAGRFLSLVTDAELEPTVRPYAGVHDYCLMCGACVPRCPVGAISTAAGRVNRACHAYLNETKERYAPRYGCGKCQTAVPCEFEMPRQPQTR